MIDPRSASFGRRADAYDQVRPPYPGAAIELLVEALDLGPSARVVDLAAGTGKLTGPLAARFPGVTAVEPSDGMRTLLRRSLPGVETLPGTAESIPLPDRGVDAVFVAEAFHWFDRERAVAEIGRVLVPGGGLALLWNRERWKPEPNPWLQRFGELIAPLLDSNPHPSERGAWTAELEAIGGLEPVTRGEIDHVHRLDPDGFVELISTWSFVANLPQAERTPLLAGVASVVSERATIELDYTTELLWTRKH